MQTSFTKLPDIAFSFGIFTTMIAMCVMSLAGFGGEAAGKTLLFGFAISVGIGCIASIKEYCDQARAKNTIVTGYISGTVEQVRAAAQAAVDAAQRPVYPSYEVDGRTYVDDFDAIRQQMADEKAARQAQREAIEARNSSDTVVLDEQTNAGESDLVVLVDSQAG